MKVILLKDVENLGRKGALVEVSDGYWRNFLLPRSLAVSATEGGIRAAEHAKAVQVQKQAREREKVMEQARQVTQRRFALRAKAGEEGKLFGSVTNQDIAQAIAGQSEFRIDKKKIELKEPIKRLGTYKIPVRLAPGISTEVTIEVQRDS